MTNSATQLNQLTAKAISKRSGERALLSEVNLTVKPGQITALIGPSGAGKTTLLKCMSLLDLPDNGRLSIDSTNYDFPWKSKVKLIPPWPKITVVFQQLFLWPHLTLRQNITLPLGDKLSTDTSDYLEQLLGNFKMHEFINRYPNQASLGQRQRTALVRAMVLKPKYILLDEITSSLDVEQVAYILTELKQMRDEGIGILLVTHLLQFAREAADSIVFIDAGKVVESGGKELLLSPKEQRIKDFIAMAQLAS